MMEGIRTEQVKKAMFVDIGTPQRLQEIAHRIAAELVEAERRGEKVYYPLTDSIILYADPIAHDNSRSS